MVSLVAELTFAGTPAEGTIMNLSLGGALISARTRHPMGTRAQISFRLPNTEHPIEVGAVVRWADDTTVGIQFDGLRARDVWALNEYFKQLPA